MKNKIILQGLEVFAHHGVLETEKQNGQLFYLDIELSVDISAAAHSDDLNDTVNYDEVCRVAYDAMTAETYDLIERAAGAVCSALLESFPLVEAVKLTLRKPFAPLCHKVDYAAVVLCAER